MASTGIGRGGARARPPPHQGVGPDEGRTVVVRAEVEVAGAHRSSAPCSSARSSGVSTEPARSTNTAIS